MAISDIQINHLRERFDQSIGTSATATVMSMLTAVDPDTLATKDDIRMVIDRMDVRFAAMDEKWTAQLQHMDDKWTTQLGAMDQKWTAQLGAMDQKWTDRIAAMDERWTERLDHMNTVWDNRMTALNDQWNTRWDSLEDRFESLEQRMTAAMFKAINRHLTFSVMAMAAISGMFTWLVR